MIKNLIEKFGGLTEMSLKTGVPISTIQYWQNVIKFLLGVSDILEKKLQRTEFSLILKPFRMMKKINERSG